MPEFQLKSRLRKDYPFQTVGYNPYLFSITLTVSVAIAIMLIIVWEILKRTTKNIVILGFQKPEKHVNIFLYFFKKFFRKEPRKRLLFSLC